MAIKGSLREASLPDVLQLLSMGKKTGCLSIAHKSNFGYIYFDKGRISYASIVNRRDRLGDILLKNGDITQAQLDAAIQSQDTHRNARIGDLLVAQGAITRELLHEQWNLAQRRYYVGEWHFHPTGRAQPSFQDRQQMVEIAQDPDYHCERPLLIIASPSTLRRRAARIFVTNDRRDLQEFQQEDPT
jgi:hypothetical protein